MENSKQGEFSGIRKIFWPIESYENKKFIPMAIMMACILFNYSMVRVLKDSFVVPNIGAEAVSFLKLYMVTPSAILFVILYAKLCDALNPRQVFYTITTIFIAYFFVFVNFIYPNPEYFHANEETIEALASQYANFKWFIKIGGKWGYATFYIMAEMWGSMMLTMLFWQFANQITKTKEAKRFYSMFGLIGNTGLLMIPVVTGFFSKVNAATGKTEVDLGPVIYVVMFVGLLVMALYYWINANVLTDPKLYDAAETGGKKKKKAKLSIGESFKMIMSSKYIGLIAILVLSYGISINLVEGIWKSKIKELYGSGPEYAAYMANFMAYQGMVAIFFMLVGSNILRSVSWAVAATFTPVMILITGISFFSFIVFDNTMGLQVAAFVGTGPLALVVAIGAAQNILSKGVKYSLFDSTKEMSYIPLDDEMKTKGKAAVDVIGGRLGKAGGALIQSTAFILFPSFEFRELTPFFACVFFFIVLVWIYAVRVLGTEYQAKIAEKEAN